jgi:Recombination endonuclease VII
LSGKNCRICGVWKPLDEFHRATGMRDGHRNECKPCFRGLAKARYDSAAAVARATQWRKDNPERFQKWQAEYRARPERKRKMRDLYYRRTFGISADEFDALLAGQSGGCAICGSVPEREASFHLDHDHLSGAIRGILCLSCNQALGHFRDDPTVLQRAADYVRGGRAT